MLNSGIHITGQGTHLIDNQTGAIIDRELSITGPSTNTIINSGTINSGILLSGTVSNVITNHVGAGANPGIGTINGEVNQGAGEDRFLMLGGRINNQVLQGPGSDRATISGGTITQFVRAEAGTESSYGRMDSSTVASTWARRTMKRPSATWPRPIWPRACWSMAGLASIA